MTDDKLRHREHILPMEKARALKQQVEAIKHQGVKLGEDDKDAGKRSTEVVGARNGINYKQVQRYIRLNELVSELQKMVNEKRLSFTPAVEISFIRPKNQQFIAVSIEGEQSAPSLSQAQKLRELDKEGKLNPDAIDGILSQEKKEVDKVILSTAELSKYFGKEVTPRQMKDQIMGANATLFQIIEQDFVIQWAEADFYEAVFLVGCGLCTLLLRTKNGVVRNTCLLYTSDKRHFTVHVGQRD